MFYPTFGVIIPTFNSVHTLHQCLDPLILSLSPTDKILVIDDASTDGTRELINEFKLNDPRIVFLDNPSRGPNAARNLGIDVIDTDYILFVDSDDHLSPDAIGILRRHICASWPDIVVMGYCFFDPVINAILTKTSEKSKLLSLDKSWIIKYAFLSRAYGHVCWNKVVSRKLVMENQIRFLPDLVHGRDSLFSKQIAIHASSLLVIPDVLYISLSRSLSFSRSFSLINIDSAIDCALQISRLQITCITIDSRNLRLLSIYRSYSYIMIISALRLPFSTYILGIAKLKTSLRAISKANGKRKLEVALNSPIRAAFVALITLHPMPMYFIIRILAPFLTSVNY